MTCCINVQGLEAYKELPVDQTPKVEHLGKASRSSGNDASVKGAAGWA